MLAIPELPPSFHAELYAEAEAEYGPKNNGLQGTSGAVERLPGLREMVTGSRRRGCHSDAPPSPFSRCFNRNVECRLQNNSLADGSR